MEISLIERFNCYEEFTIHQWFTFLKIISYNLLIAACHYDHGCSLEIPSTGPQHNSWAK